ncbi:hypothetical protein HYC85_005088 [Camellia sinensis]|uniref:CCHC-type domain-containing protein n=1 Tax=Camellia sinensis TaxID=4442 RepID=A0A7J7HYF1_CAMSI|nr:hypothetical protein HYC85_005088 [Camellia sinensis]
MEMMFEEEVIVGSNSYSTTPVSHLNNYSPNSIASPGGRNSSTRPQPQSQPNRRLFVTEEEEKKDNRKGSCFLCDKHGHWMKDCPTKSPKTPSSSQSPSPSSPSPIGGHGVPNLICRCGTGTCFVRRSKTTRNPDRLFYCCPLTDKSCNFFEWCDEVWNDKITVPVCRCIAGPCSIYKEPTFTRSNAGRYFFVCPIKKGQGACDFIQSLDATSSHSDRSVISQSTLTNCHDTSPSSSDLVEDGDFSQQGMDVVSHVVNSSERPQKLGAISEISKRDKVKLMDFQAQEETPDEPMRKHCKRQRHEAPEIDGFILDSTSYCSDMPQSKSGDPTTTKALRASTITSEGWCGRLVFSPSRCLIFPAPKPFFCCVFPAFDPIFVPQDVDTFDAEAPNIAMPSLSPAQSNKSSLLTPPGQPLGSSLSGPSGLSPPPKILQGNIMTNSIVEVFKQAAVRLQDDLLNVLKSKDFHDHESMILEACSIFGALDALFVDSQPFKEQVEEFIGCAASLAEVELSINNDRSAQELVIMYERKKRQLEDISRLHAETRAALEASNEHHQFLQKEASRVKDELLCIEEQLSSCEGEKMKIGNRLDQITEDMLNSEASLQVAFGEAEAAMKLCQQREAERNVAKEAFEKARSNLRRSL